VGPRREAAGLRTGLEHRHALAGRRQAIREREPEHSATDDPDPRARHPILGGPCSPSGRGAASALSRSLVAALLLGILAGPAVAKDRVLVRWLPAAGGPVDGYV